MAEHIVSLLDVVTPTLFPGEKVWAVYTGSRALVATDRRLIFVSNGDLTSYDLADFERVARSRDDLVVLDRMDAPPIAVPVAPDDEAGLQALTVVGLLVALRDHLEGEDPVEGGDPAP